jgi:hypothetical protein
MLSCFEAVHSDALLILWSAYSIVTTENVCNSIYFDGAFTL